jgi:hypothetical protein
MGRSRARIPDLEVARTWMTPEIREALAAIKGKWAIKKRATVIRLAFAKANRQPLKAVFKLEDVCSEVIWYGKWRHLEPIRAALEVCKARCLEWADEETATIEAHFSRKRRQSVAEFAALAPAALSQVMAGTEQKGSDRIKAATVLIGLADPERGKVEDEVEVEGEAGGGLERMVGGLSDEELEQVLANLAEVEVKVEVKVEGDPREGLG